jgi:hypothetical protein
MNNKFLSVSKIFKVGAVIGLLTGIAIMYLLNGIFGHASIKEGIIAFLTFEGSALLALLLIFKQLKIIWNLSFAIYPKTSSLPKK